MPSRLRPASRWSSHCWGYAIDSGEVEPRLATTCAGNSDVTVWTCTLRDGVKFHDDSDFDANDVVTSWRAGLVSGDPLHTGNTGTFENYSYLLNALIPDVVDG